MRIQAAVLVLLLTLAGPAMALRADSASSTLEASVASNNPWLLWKVAQNTGLASISAEGGNAHVVDDVYYGAIRAPGSSTALTDEQTGRGEQTLLAPSGVSVNLAGWQQDARMLALPLSPDTLDARGTNMLAAQSESAVLEESHAFGSSQTPLSPYYYQYAFDGGVNVTLSDATISMRGNITLYLWGVSFVWDNHTSAQQVDTGFHGEKRVPGPLPVSQPVGPDVGNTVEDDHYTFAVLYLHNAVIQASMRQVSLYSDSFTVGGGSLVTYSGASGTVPVDTGEAIVSGDTVTVGGTPAILRGQGSGLDVQFQGPASHIAGSVHLPETPWWASPWMGLAAGSATLLAVVGLTLALPNLIGTRVARAQGTFAVRRAAGFALLRGWADSLGFTAVAAWFAGRAARWDGLPGASIAYAEFLHARGRYAKALAVHAKTSESLELQADAAEWAWNAFGAARCAARLGRSQEALHWLRLSVEAEPGLSRDASLLADFASLASDGEFQSIRGTVRTVA